ncbi:hypothetical protein GQ53DRAFT_819602 [Thozetella sp. PMI_491]|nr:hypothetical protein GQ53DRAFT_819602 [Thozetella sp. PMI_491]
MAVYPRWAVSFVAAAMLAEASPDLDRRAACVSDNLLNKFPRTSSSAVPFCQTYIGAYAYQTTTVTTDFNSCNCDGNAYHHTLSRVLAVDGRSRLAPV